MDKFWGGIFVAFVAWLVYQAGHVAGRTAAVADLLEYGCGSDVSPDTPCIVKVHVDEGSDGLVLWVRDHEVDVGWYD